MKTAFFVLLSFFVSASAFADEVKEAQYEVPVREELKPFAAFSIPAVTTTELDGEQVQLDYLLPLELTGNPNRIVMSGSYDRSGGATFKGAHATAQCKADAAAWTCSVRFRGLDLNSVKALEAIHRGATTPQEAEGRAEVARSFFSDPIGILTYPGTSTY